MPRTDALPPTAIARAGGPPDRRWVPLELDRSALVEVYTFGERGTGLHGLRRAITGSRSAADRALAEGLARMMLAAGPLEIPPLRMPTLPPLFGEEGRSDA